MWRQILQHIGAQPDEIGKIRFGKGVIGKTSTVTAVGLMALGAVAWGLADPIYRIVAGLLIAGLALTYLVFAYRFATRNPAAALLEGGELLQWRQMELGAQGVQILQPQANTTPPQIEHEGV